MKKQKAVYTTAFRELWEQMKEDGVWLSQHSLGYQFYVGEYRVTNKEIGRVWGMNQSALYRFIQYLLEGGDKE
mgnify:CR=1 FL=1